MSFLLERPPAWCYVSFRKCIYNAGFLVDVAEGDFTSSHLHHPKLPIPLRYRSQKVCRCVWRQSPRLLRSFSLCFKQSKADGCLVKQPMVFTYRNDLYRIIHLKTTTTKKNDCSSLFSHDDPCHLKLIMLLGFPPHLLFPFTLPHSKNRAPVAISCPFHMH